MASPRPPAFISRQVVDGRYFFGDLAPPPEVPLAVACAGCEDCAPDYRMLRRSFRYHALEFIDNGRWKLQFGDRISMLGPGSVFLYGPTAGYRLEALGGSPLRKYFVDLSGPEAESMFARHGIPGDRPVTLDQAARMREVFDQLIDCADLPPEAARPLALHLAELLLMRVRVDSRAGSPVREQAHQSYQRARRLIRERHAALGSVEEVARACGLSPAYLSRLFRRYGGEGPLQFLTRLRMQHAADLLLRHSTNVQETAAALGFADPFHFSRVFKRVHGLSPKAFVEARREVAGGRQGRLSEASGGVEGLCGEG